MLSSKKHLQFIKAMSPIRNQILPDVKLPVVRKKCGPRSTKNNMAEKKFEEKVIWYLRNNGCIVSKSGEMSNYNSHYIMPGIADLFCFVPSKSIFVFIECKTEKGSWRDSQKIFKKLCDSVKIPYILCRRMEDLKCIL